MNADNYHSLKTIHNKIDKKPQSNLKKNPQKINKTSTEIDRLLSGFENSNHLNAPLLNVAFYLVIRHKNSYL